MANAFYTKFKEALLAGEIDFETNAIKAVLLDTAVYTFSAAHQYLSSVAAGARISTATLTGKSITDGVFDAADTVFSAPPATSAEATGLYMDSGADATSPLICYLDTGITGLPFTGDGIADATMEWPAAGIFTL